MSTKLSTKSDMEVLDPQPVELRIGERTYMQKPLSLADMGVIMSLMVRMVNSVASSGSLDEIMGLDMKTEEGKAAALPVMMKVIMLAPEMLPQVLGALLSVKDAEEIEYLNQHCRPRTLVTIMETFLDQNEPGELFAAFLILKTRVVTMAKMMRS